MKTILQTLCAFLLLVGSACAQYTYPQAQIGQVALTNGPTMLGDGSLITKDTVLENAELQNVSTADVVATVLPDHRIWEKVVAAGATKGTYRMYKLNHTKAVAENDVLVLKINGVPRSTFRVRKYPMFGFAIIWDLAKDKDVPAP